MLNTLETALAGDWLDEFESSIQSIRSGCSNIISPNIAAAAQRPFLKQLCKSVIGRGNLSNDIDMWREVYKYYIDNSLRVQSRNFTFASPSAGTNSGNGQIVRLTTDKYNFPIESSYVDGKRAICVLDENTGTRRGQETFEIRAQAKSRDELERSGSGLIGTLVGQTIDDSLLNNAGFRAFSGTAAAPTGLTNWTSTGGDSSSIYTLDSTNYFRVAPSDGSTSYALKTAASSRFQQKLTSAKIRQLDSDTPWLIAVVWNRQVNSASGTLNIRLGSVTTTVSVSAQTGWNVTLCPNPVGQSCWYRNFAQADITFEVEWIQTASGLLIGEVLLIPGIRFDNHWYWAIPASTATYAQWRVLDSYTWNDIASGSAKIQTWIHRGFPGIYLPSSNGSSITWTEPS